MIDRHLVVAGDGKLPKLLNIEGARGIYNTPSYISKFFARSTLFVIVIALITLTVIPLKIKTTVKHNMFDGSIKI